MAALAELHDLCVRDAFVASATAAVAPRKLVSAWGPADVLVACDVVACRVRDRIARSFVLCLPAYYGI